MKSKCLPQTCPSPWLEPIPVELRATAEAAFQNGDVGGFFVLASNEYWLDLLIRNSEEFQAAGMYEEALLLGLTACRVNNHAHSLDMLRWLIQIADRGKLRAAGDPILPRKEFKLYRGVAGHGPARRIRGVSWTDCKECAEWFAARSSKADPAVYCATVERSDVYAFTDQRGEREYVVLLPKATRVTRLPELINRERAADFMRRIHAKGSLIKCASAVKAGAPQSATGDP